MSAIQIALFTLSGVLLGLAGTTVFKTGVLNYYLLPFLSICVMGLLFLIEPIHWSLIVLVYYLAVFSGAIFATRLVSHWIGKS